MTFIDTLINTTWQLTFFFGVIIVSVGLFFSTCVSIIIICTEKSDKFTVILSFITFILIILWFTVAKYVDAHDLDIRNIFHLIKQLKAL